MADFTWKEVQLLQRKAIAEHSIGYIINLHRAVERVLERLDEAGVECASDNCRKNEELRGHPDKWCTACLVKVTEEDLRNALNWIA